MSVGHRVRTCEQDRMALAGIDSTSLPPVNVFQITQKWVTYFALAMTPSRDCQCAICTFSKTFYPNSLACAIDVGHDNPQILLN